MVKSKTLELDCLVLDPGCIIFKSCYVGQFPFYCASVSSSVKGMIVVAYFLTHFLKSFIYLFIYGCAGCSLLHAWGFFSSCSEWGFSAQVSHCMYSLVVEHGL